MKTIEQIVDEFEEFKIYVPEIYQGIMTKESWYAWKRRGVPKNVIKYFKILERLEELQQRKKEIMGNLEEMQPRKKDLIPNGWGPSNNHSI